MITNKNSFDILNDERLNKSFLSATLNDLDISCKIYKGNFYAIDPNLFSPGKVTVTSLETDKIFVEGKLNSDLLDKSFGYEKS